MEERRTTNARGNMRKDQQSEDASEGVWGEGSRRSKKWVAERNKLSIGYGRYNEIMFNSEDEGNEATTRVSPR